MEEPETDCVSYLLLLLLLIVDVAVAVVAETI